ncbi:hypothetical protein D9619_002524 [Psilocybe cf. subviscida]|uniref:Homeobox domain-containing protein n=1 Tax=Psilocybe cf. subviscida TaxID=2480587 RepID=A0A8H5AVR0_9AGAR|nr:hypothetical protein D9619_002524 [Psilocybe cf. subviscida]
MWTRVHVTDNALKWERDKFRWLIIAVTATAMNPFPQNPPLARTDSSASFSSEDDASMSSSVTVIGSTRRTRKRFSNVQLTMLENLFHQNSHPSREDRENVAKAGGMEIKSVTIWFQNKRQTERKTAASNNPNNISGGGHSPNVVPNITSILHTFSLHNTSHHSTSRTSSPPFSATASSRSGSGGATSSIISTTGMGAPRPTLDRVASRSELRSSAPRTPRRPAPGAPTAIWDSMPSSPLAPPISPPAREFIDFGKHKSTRRTLEWACAAARLADKDGYASGMSAGFGGGHGAPQGAMSMGMAGDSISSARDPRDRDSYRDEYRDGSYRESYRDGYSQSRHGHTHAAVASDVHGKGRTVHRQKSHIHISEREREDREREDERERHRERERDRDSHRERGEREREAYHRPREYYAHQPSQPYPPRAHSQERYRSSHPRSPVEDRDRDSGMMTDDEDRDEDQDPEHEAITPSSTWGKDDRRWTAAPAEGGGTNVSLMALGASAVNALGHTGSQGSVGSGSRRMSESKMARERDGERERDRDGDRPLPKGVDDDDMFKAALALCGLGRRA